MSYKMKNMAAQGDLMIRRVEALPPSGLTRMEAKDGHLVVAHSETGHHHAFEDRMGLRVFRSEADPMISFLEVDAGLEAVLTHHRSFDTHAPIILGEGTYELRRQREPAPEGWRMVAD